MNEIKVRKETTVQAYGIFWDAFYVLSEKAALKEQHWSKLKLSALTMACFAIEAFANHVGQHLHGDWETNGQWQPPIEKLKALIKELKVEIKIGEAPFQTIDRMMDWRNKVAHCTTETFVTNSNSDLENYDHLLGQIEKAAWEKFYFAANLDKIKKDSENVMELIHEKAFGNLEWFLSGSRHIGSAGN